MSDQGGRVSLGKIFAVFATIGAVSFGGGARAWLGVQMDYDLAQAMKYERAIKVKRVREASRGH